MKLELSRGPSVVSRGNPQALPQVIPQATRTDPPEEASVPHDDPVSFQGGGGGPPTQLEGGGAVMVEPPECPVGDWREPAKTAASRSSSTGFALLFLDSMAGTTGLRKGTSLDNSATCENRSPKRLSPTRRRYESEGDYEI